MARSRRHGAAPAAPRWRGAAARGTEIARQMRRLDMPWARSAPARVVRAALLAFVLGPMIAYYVRPAGAGTSASPS